MQETSDDVSALIEALNLGRQAWISGNLEWSATSAFEQANDMTIFAPFGGEAAIGDPIRQAKVAANFRGGSGHCQVVKVMQEGALAVIVMVEWNQVSFAEGAEEQPWVLRTTQVFRQDKPGHWIRLHRHADPLINRRSLEETLSLLKEDSGAS